MNRDQDNDSRIPPGYELRHAFGRHGPGWQIWRKGQASYFASEFQYESAVKKAQADDQGEAK